MYINDQFNSLTMEKASRKELLTVIAKQEEDLAKYKSRFQAVVAAHKRLLKEKEALELSLKVMSRTSSVMSHVSSNADLNEDFDVASVDSLNTVYSITTGSSTKSGSETDPLENGGYESVDHLRSQLATLMNSLATLSEEKSRMEASFQADKRQLRSEKEELEQKVKELQKKLEQCTRIHLNEIENYKSKLIVERHQREKEHNDHGVMIRELQKVLAEERSLREQAQSQVDDVKREWAAVLRAKDKREKEILDQLEAANSKLNVDEMAAPLVSALQEEIDQLKQEHAVALQNEKQRVNDLENKIRKQAALHEVKVVYYEERLAELSETLGAYNKMREEDQSVILKLKEKLEACSNPENNKAQNVADRSMEEENEKDVPEKKESNLHADEDNELENYSKANHALCIQEYQKLKNEYDSYKHSVCSMEKRTTSTNVPTVEQIELLNKQINSLKDKVRALRSELDIVQEEAKLKSDEQCKQFNAERSRWESKLNSCEQDYRRKLVVLEEQLTKQRERALALMNEKEQEILSLKASFQALIPTPRIRFQSQTSENEETEKIEITSGDFSDGRHMIFYAQETARYQVDLANLRKAKHILERTLRDMQHSAAEEREALNQKIAKLTEQVDRLERCKSREGENLEYLKNVILNFILSNDSRSKSHMLNAIVTILKFSDEERRRVEKIY